MTPGRGLPVALARWWLAKLRFVFAGTAAAVFGCAPAHAAGINLSWDDCGLSGVHARTFACDTNTGASFSLIGSFFPTVGISEFTGLSAEIQIRTPEAALPSWWAHGSGQCRGTTGLSVDFDFISGRPLSCDDVMVGMASGSFIYEAGYGGANRARLRLQCSLPFDYRPPLDYWTEYAGFRVSISLSKTTGTESCPGCAENVCIELAEVQLFQSPELAFDPVLTNPVDRKDVVWQGPHWGCVHVPVRAKTWGQLKSLYQ